MGEGQDYEIDKNECWNWLGRLNTHGYAIYSDGELRESAHRVYYQAYKGELTEGLEIDHLCANKKCVNPSHLEEVTHQINSQRRNWCKLDDELVLEIRRLRKEEGLTYRSLANHFSVGITTIRSVIKGLSWSNIK